MEIYTVKGQLLGQMLLATAEQHGHLETFTMCEKNSRFLKIVTSPNPNEDEAIVFFMDSDIIRNSFAIYKSLSKEFCDLVISSYKRDFDDDGNLRKGVKSGPDLSRFRKNNNRSESNENNVSNLH